MIDKREILRTPEEFADFFENKWGIDKRSKEDLIELFKASRKVFFDTTSEKTYKEISEIMTWYSVNGSTAFSDELLAKRDRLAVLSFDLAVLVGEAKGEYNSAYFLNRINIARDKQTQIEKNLAYNKAENKAILDNEEFYRDAIEKESISFKNDILLRQLNKTLDAMNQRISYEKSSDYNNKKMINNRYDG